VLTAPQFLSQQAVLISGGVTERNLMVIICMYNIKMDPKKLGCDNVNYINLTHVGWWCSVLNTVTNIQVL